MKLGPLKKMPKRIPKNHKVIMRIDPYSIEWKMHKGHLRPFHKATYELVKDE